MLEVLSQEVESLETLDLTENFVVGCCCCSLELDEVEAKEEA